MKSIAKRISQVLQKEFIDGTIYRVDLDRVDVAPAGSSGILRSLPLTGDRDKIKVGDNVKVITVAGQRVAIAGDMALDGAVEAVVEDASAVELAERFASIPASAVSLTSLIAPSIGGWVYLTSPLVSASWTAKILSTTANKTAINLRTQFGLPDGATAILGRILLRDIASSTWTDIYLALGPSSAGSEMPFVARANGLPNNFWHDEMGVIAVGADGNIYYTAWSSGSNTLTVYFQIWGYFLPEVVQIDNAQTLSGYSPRASGTDAHVALTNATGGLSLTDLSLSGSIKSSTAIFCRVKRTTAQTITTSTTTWTAISFNTQVNDQPASVDQWSLAAPTQVFCRVDGVYAITGHIIWAPASAGTRRYASLRTNGTTFVAQTSSMPSGTVTSVQNIAAIVPMTAGEYVELVVMQDSGADLNSYGSADPNILSQNTLEMVRIA